MRKINKLVLLMLHSTLKSSSFSRSASLLRDLRLEADLSNVDSDLNAVIMDYLISEGYPSAAQKFAHEANITPMMDVDSVEERVAIREALHKGDIQTAIERINEVNPQV